MQLLCKITYIAWIVFLVASSGQMQHLNDITWAANFCNLSLFKLECQYAFCFCGIWICIHECDVCLHTHPYSCKNPITFGMREIISIYPKLLFSHTEMIFFPPHLFVLIKPAAPKSTTWKRLLEQFIFPLHGLERWYLEQLVKEKSLALALALCLMTLSSCATSLICTEIGTNCIYNVILLNSKMYDKS